MSEELNEDASPVRDQLLPLFQRHLQGRVLHTSTSPGRGFLLQQLASIARPGPPRGRNPTEPRAPEPDRRATKRRDRQWAVVSDAR